MNNLDQFTFNFYPSTTKVCSNFIKYHEPTKLYPSNSGKLNINLNSYRFNTNLPLKHNKIHKRKDHNNNFNVNHKPKMNSMMNSHRKNESNNIALLLNNLKQEITEISNNIKETDNKVELYMNKNNINNIKKTRNNSANISKNSMISLPRHKYSFTNKGGISLNLINSNCSKSTNFIRNIPKKDKIVTDYTSNMNNITSNNNRLTYDINTQQRNKNNCNKDLMNINNINNINQLTIQTNNNYSLNKFSCLNSYYNRKKFFNNYINDIHPKYHTAENFYHRERKKKPCTYIYKKNINTNYNECDNSNKSSIDNSIKKMMKNSSYKDNLIEKSYNKNKKRRYNKDKYDKYNTTYSNQIKTGIYDSINSVNNVKIGNEELKCDFMTTNNINDYNDNLDSYKNKNLLQIDLKLKEEKIYNLNREIQRLKNTINIKNSIINILKCGNNNTNNENINNMNEIYSNNNSNIQNKNTGNITLNYNIKVLQNEIEKLRYNLNLQKSDDYLNLQNKNKELINENISLKQQLKNVFEMYYATEKIKLEKEIKSKDKQLKVLMNDITNIDKEKKILKNEIKKLKDKLNPNSDKNNNNEIHEIEKYKEENKNLKEINSENIINIEKLKNEIINEENKYKNIINELNAEISKNKIKEKETEIIINTQNKNIE